MGGTSQSSSNKTTYSNVGCYASDGYLYSNSTKVAVTGATTSAASSSSTGPSGTAATGGPSSTTELRNISYSYSGTILTITDNGAVNVASSTHTHSGPSHTHTMSHTHTQN
jgi:hypothetical protein